MTIFFYIYKIILVTVSERSKNTQFWITIATNCRELTRLHERKVCSRSWTSEGSQCIVSIMWTFIIFCCGYMKKRNWAYGNFECNFLFENMRLEDAHKVQFSKIVPRVLLWSQQANPSGNLTDICWQHCSRIPVRLLEFTYSWINSYYISLMPLAMSIVDPTSK
jgi:hypothetical protein